MTVLAFQPHDSHAARQRRDSQSRCLPDSTPASAAAMTRSSPARRAPLWTTPDRTSRCSFLLDDRNSEMSHLDALNAAQVEHDRVRETAIRVFELHELREEHRRVKDLGRREEERLKAEAKVAAEEQRLRELRAKSIPKSPPQAASGNATKPTTNHSAAAAATQPLQTKPQPTEPPQQAKTPSTNPAANTGAHAGSKLSTSETPSVLQNGLFANLTKPKTSSPLSSTTQVKNESPAAIHQPVAAKPTFPTSPAKSLPLSTGVAPTRPPDPPAVHPAADRLVQIHQELKTLRKDLMALSKTPGSPLKGKVGTFRREIRVAIGQLTAGRGANTQPTNKIMTMLKGAAEGQIASPLVDMKRFLATPPASPGAANNSQGMPALFVYLINVCAKGIISQFINECGANPKAADPIGVFAAQLFSHKDFQWQGQSLIDILIAKFRVVCPVLFGIRGSDKTERGRQAIGWRKDGPAWITEQTHNDRMAGLGAGFAAVSLRDFSKSTKENPYPPTNYWTAMAAIVGSPPKEVSNTQYVVLRAMIEGHERRFLNFYGNAAAAALRMALIEFPKKAPEGATGAGSLRALADLLRSEKGMYLSMGA